MKNLCLNKICLLETDPVIIEILRLRLRMTQKGRLRMTQKGRLRMTQKGPAQDDRKEAQNGKRNGLTGWQRDWVIQENGYGTKTAI